jgi:hypothetical protein
MDWNSEIFSKYWSDEPTFNYHGGIAEAENQNSFLYSRNYTMPVGVNADLHDFTEITQFSFNGSIQKQHVFHGGYTDQIAVSHESVFLTGTTKGSSDFDTSNSTNSKMFIAKINGLTSTDRINNKFSIRIYPNPFTDIISFNGLNQNVRYTISLVDELGKEISNYKFDGVSECILNFESTNPGFYLLSINGSDGIKSRVKLVKCAK